LPAVSGPKPGSANSCGALGDGLGDLGLEPVDRVRQLAQAADLVAGDANARCLLGAAQAPSDPGRPHLR
jgi:hypothetical protein